MYIWPGDSDSYTKVLLDYIKVLNNEQHSTAAGQIQAANGRARQLIRWIEHWSIDRLDPISITIDT